MKSHRPGKDVLRQMKACELFRDLSAVQFNAIVDHSSLVVLKEGETLFEQDAKTTALFFLSQGQIKLTLLARDGNDKVVDIINEGQTFAEAIVFGGQHGYPVSAQAVTSSEVLRIDAHYYREFISNHKDASLSLLANMSRRLHWQLKEIDRLTLHTAAYRLVVFLLDQLGDNETGHTIHLKTPKNIIASRLTIKPETFSRTLKKLADAGYIEVNESTIYVTDIQKLKKYVALEGHENSLI